ncbi:MAG TPA: outer membrane beta-barrel protein [Polyangia bacterium]
MTDTVDSTFASGVGLSASVDVFHGLMVGIAPQAIFKGKVKAQPDGTETTFGSDKQIDLMLRVAYAYTIPDVVTLYAELLPGYSTVSSDVTDTSKGLVLAYGIGAELDVAKRVFANLGIGYEMGFQRVSSTSIYRHDYVRAAIGVGTRF